MLFDDKEPRISGYLIIGKEHYQIVGKRISTIRTELTVKKIAEDVHVPDEQQGEMFDEAERDG